MKAFILIILSAACSCILQAQSITNYQFSASSGTFTPLSGGNTMALTIGTVNDGYFNYIPVGFTFYYMGTAYTTVSASTNGWMTFGQDAAGSYPTNNLTSSGTRPLVAPLWDDLSIQTNTNFSYQTSGSAPNRIFTAEWLNLKWLYFASAGAISFQVRLYESTGRTEFIYHPESGALLSPSASIGITAAGSNSGNFLSLNNATASPVVSSTTETFIISTKPADGQVYAFVPPASATAPISMNFTDITKTGMTIGWTDNSTTENWFVAYYSQDGINFTQIGSAIPSTTSSGTGTSYSVSKTGLLPGVTYYFRVTANNEGTPSSAFLSGSQSTVAPTEITSLASGNWSVTSTWSTGAVPTSLDNVTIANTHTVIIDATADCNTLTVGQGISGILRFGTGTAKTLNIVQGIVVATAAIFDAGAASGANLTHILNVGGTSPTAMGTGNLTVNGTFDMYIGSSNGKCTVTFFGIPDASVSGTGTIDFYRATLNKGNTTATATVTPPVLEMLSAWSGSGVATTGFLYTHTAGTLKIGGNFTYANTVYSQTGYDIPLLGGFWINNPNFTVNGLTGSPTNNGLLKLSTGIYNIGTATGNTMNGGTGSVFLVENGTMNVTGRFNVTNAVTFNQSGGMINVTTVGNTSSGSPGFGITNAGSSFTISGGTICLVKANTSTGTKVDYNVAASTTNITNGTLQLGNSGSGSAQPFMIRGTAPNVILTNTGGNHSCGLAGSLTIKGDLTLNSPGAFSNSSNSLTMEGMNATYPGNITVNTGSVLTLNTSAAAALSFTGSAGNQALANSGNITSGLLPSLTINNTASGGTVTLPNGLTVMGDATVNMLKGNLNAGSGITFGTGGSTGFTYVKSDGTVTGPVSFNYGTGTVNYTYNGTSPQTTGSEMPGTINGTLTINNAAGVSLNNALQTGKLTLTSGTLSTSAVNLLTISGTGAADLTYTAGMISGPMQRTLPSSLVTGSTYLFPLGKSAYKPLELVNPITNAGGTVIIKAEVFDIASGGTAGSTMVSLNTDRYWNAEITSGGTNFTSSTLRLTETGMTVNSGIAKSSTLAGTYELASINPPSGNTLVTDAMTTLSYYVIGNKKMNYLSSTTTQPITTPVRQGSPGQAIIRVEVVTSGNLEPAEVSSFTFNTNGSTSPSDIAAAKVYFTGTSSTFATSSQFGSDYSSPSGSFIITGTQALAEGTNYFWLAYDIAVNTGASDVVDGECSLVTVRGVARTPTQQAPTGSRSILVALSGTVTVGSSGTYLTLSGTGGLFEAINAAGLRGNITAQIVSNTTETGAVALSQFYEVAGTNFTLTIQPDASSERTLSGSYTGGLIRFSGADRVTIDGNYGGAGKFLTITNTATSGTIATIQLVSGGVGLGSTNITLKNCKISTGHNNSDSYGIAAGGTNLGSAGADNDSLVIRNCNITKTNYGIYAMASASGLNNVVVISGDSIGSSVSGNYVGRYGVYLLYCTDLDISGNKIFNIQNSVSSSRGIYLTAGCVNATISKNLITGIKYTGSAVNAYGSAGIDIMTGLPASNMTISNNIISDISGMGSTYWGDAIAGIRIQSGTSGISLYYNSVNLFGSISHSTMSPDNSAAIYIAGESGIAGITLKNNVFRNSIVNTASTFSKAYAIYSDMYKTGYAMIDFNDYFAGGTQGKLGYLYPATATTIEEWRSRTSQDAHSLGDDPYYAADTDLHLDFTAPALHGGNPVTGIPADYENVARNDTAPAMGALETGVDARGPVITYTPLTTTASLLDRTLTATVTDYTGVPITGAGLPVLYWNINHGSWSAATGVNLGASQYQFTFGAGVSPSDSVFYYIAAQDTWAVPNVSVSPGAGASGGTINPPAFTVPPSYPEAYKVAIGLSGTITVGSGGTYPTLTGYGGLFETVNENLLTGNVEATVISDLVEPGTYRLYKWTEEGAGNYSLTIRPDGMTERLISGSPSQGLITLDGPSRVTINGSYGDTTSRYLRIRNTNTSNPVIHFLNGATGNTIRNCYLESSATGGIVTFGTSTKFIGNSNNYILYNVIRDRTDSPSAFSYGVYSYGSGSNPNKENSISGNEIFNFKYSAIYVTGNGNGGQWIITGNSIYHNQTTPPTTIQNGINFIPEDNSFGNIISGNYIGGQSAHCGGGYWLNSGTGEFCGISFYAGYASNHIENNTIQNINQSNENSDGFTGIYLREGYAYIAGNTIGHDDTTKTIRSTTYYQLTGIRVESGTMTSTISKNTIANLLVTAPNTSSPAVLGIYMYSANLRQNRIYGLGTCHSSGITPDIYGIWNDGLYNGATNEISNNLIALDGFNSSNPQIYGYYEYSYPTCTYNFYNNSISISGPATTLSSTYAFYSASDPTYEMKDNVLSNFRFSGDAGSLGVNYAIYFDYPGIIASDYNDIYCGSGTLAYYYYTNMPDLAAWKTATFLDSNSISLNPLFLDPSIDLHPDFSSPLLMAGIPLPDITVDIVDTARSLVSPSIGAYEITTATSKTWNGSFSSAWNLADNWTPAGVPVTTDNLSIPSATPFNCILNVAGLDCKHIVIRNGATVTVNSSAGITIHGTLTIENGGTLANDGTVILKGSLVNKN